MRTCQRIFEAQEESFCSEKAKIYYAESFLQDHLQESWEWTVDNKGAEARNWARLKEFLQELVQPAATRGVTVFRRWRHAQQGATQSVQEFVNHLEQQEHLLPVMDEEIRRLDLLAGLRQEIYEHLTALASLGQSRAEVITQAQMVEESLREFRRLRGGGAAPFRQSHTQYGFSTSRTPQPPNRQDPRDSEVRTTSYRVVQRTRHGRNIEGSNAPVARGPDKCFKCGKEGHRVRECRSTTTTTSKDQNKGETPKGGA